MTIVTPVAAFLLIAVSLLYAGIRFWQNRHALPLPPGPKGIPILGNVNDMPKPGMLECHHWLQHKELYGPISSVTAMGQTIVIINDPTIALDLLRDRSAIYSSRPSLVFAGDMVGWRHATVMIPYNDVWKIHRKNITKITSTSTSLSVFDRVQEAEAARFLVNMLESPDRLFEHVRKEAGSVILKITYGYNIVSHGKDPLVDVAEKTMEQFAEATVPGRWAVDIFPFMKYIPDWMPGAGFKRTAKEMAKQLDQCTTRPYEFVKQQMQEKRHTPSFLSQSIESADSTPEMEFYHKWAALALYLGGADTTVSAISTFFLAIHLFPTVQSKAQQEIDSLTHGLRLPTLADLPNLPYISAIVQETHRWHLVAPMGIPHTSTKEDVYMGYRIPKGSILLANNWGFMHDPAVYRDPMAFRPERFIASEGREAEPDPRTHVFGYGRRICPGRQVADHALFVTIAQTLAVFNVSPSIDAEGRVKRSEVKFEPGTISRPVPFSCRITPRSNAHITLIQEAGQRFAYEESDAAKLENITW
ncbi:hypothetical protein COCCADRAFT_2996 [Bipolaris zeicola 26-R-13]|uniref:Cytochrome P450 n=1 Tax=Cochliobolus carbonum (strain 26-R-13) TaxID=930089 RepID=W6YWF5_COCC2|nr:uncharacterized protein COCCADRAFT_2996 [Bipolaris zeicola 26-R-13]EUC35841.1 hypothetical protein COCCADRAFT_2996 [Bipolaris zeicola 26-R-13]